MALPSVPSIFFLCLTERDHEIHYCPSKTASLYSSEAPAEAIYPYSRESNSLEVRLRGSSSWRAPRNPNSGSKRSFAGYVRPVALETQADRALIRRDVCRFVAAMRGFSGDALYPLFRQTAWL